MNAFILQQYVRTASFWSIKWSSHFSFILQLLLCLVYFLHFSIPQFSKMHKKEINSAGQPNFRMLAFYGTNCVLRSSSLLHCALLNLDIHFMVPSYLSSKERSELQTNGNFWLSSPCNVGFDLGRRSKIVWKKRGGGGECSWKSSCLKLLTAKKIHQGLGVQNPKSGLRSFWMPLLDPD